MTRVGVLLLCARRAHVLKSESPETTFTGVPAVNGSYIVSYNTTPYFRLTDVSTAYSFGSKTQLDNDSQSVTFTMPEGGCADVAATLSSTMANFYRWMVNGTEASLDQNTTLTFSANSTVTAETCGMKFQVRDVGTYDYWEDAFKASADNGNKDVILIKGGSLPETFEGNNMSGPGTYVTGTDGALTYTVPAGVRLILPMDGATTTVQTDASYPYANTNWLVKDKWLNNGDVAADVQDNINVEVTLPQNATLLVADGGSLIIGGALGRTAQTVKQYSLKHEDAGVTQTFQSYHANLQLLEGSKVKMMGSSSVLSVCGFIYGEGEIDAGTATVYQPFVIRDFGGGYTIGVGKNASNQVDNSVIDDAKMYFPSGEKAVNAIKDAKNAGGTVVLMRDIVLGNSIPIDSAQNITISLNDNGTAYTIAYSATPFINEGTLKLDLGGGTITNLSNGVYAATEALTNNAMSAATIDLNGGKIIVQAPAGQTAQFNAVVNYGTLSVADTKGGGGIYCYGPLGANADGWKNIKLKTNLKDANEVYASASVKAEVYADTLAKEVIYTGIFNTGTITSVSGGTIRSPMYGIYSGSASSVSYPQVGLGNLDRAKAAVKTTARIQEISGGVIEGGWVGLMNNGAAIDEITGGTFKSAATMFVANGDVIYSALYNGYGTIGNVSKAIPHRKDAK